MAPTLDHHAKKYKKVDIQFPEGFQFGVSTAAWQIENILKKSNWSLFENDNKCPEHNIACDAFNHVNEDIEIMKKMGIKLYRFSISWSDLSTGEGSIDSAILEKYKSFINKLIDNGIQPMVTLYHFEHPEWLENKGGILSPGFIKEYKLFVEKTVEALQKVQYWITVNEPNIMSQMGYLFGTFPPGHKSFNQYFLSICTLMECHVKGYDIIKKANPNSRISFALNVTPIWPYNKYSIIETLIASVANQINTSILDSFLTGEITFTILGKTYFSQKIEGIVDKWDFIAINHYFGNWVSINPFKWDSLPCFSRKSSIYEQSDFNWPLSPDSLAKTVEWIHNKWNPKNLEIIISENGIADRSDDKRQWFLTSTLYHLSNAISEYSLPVTKYIHWSLMDNYEWAEGYTKCFGLCEIDFTDDKRQRKPRTSADLYKRIIKHNK